MRHLIPIAALLVTASGCAEVPKILGALGPVACGELVAVLSPDTGQYWGTACSGLARAISSEIAAELAATPRAARTSCVEEVAVPGFEGSAVVCKGLEQAARRGAEKVGPTK